MSDADRIRLNRKSLPQPGARRRRRSRLCGRAGDVRAGGQAGLGDGDGKSECFELADVAACFLGRGWKRSWPMADGREEALLNQKACLSRVSRYATLCLPAWSLQRQKGESDANPLKAVFDHRVSARVRATRPARGNTAHRRYRRPAPPGGRPGWWRLPLPSGPAERSRPPAPPGRAMARAGPAAAGLNRIWLPVALPCYGSYCHRIFEGLCC